MTTVFTHHDMDRSKDHCIVLPERACKSTSAYAAVCFVLFCWLVFLVLGTLGKHCLKEVLISPFLEHIHTRTFIFPSGKYNPVRFFFWASLGTYYVQKNKAAHFTPLVLTRIRWFLLLLLFICSQVSCVHLAVLLWSHILAYSVIFFCCFLSYIGSFWWWFWIPDLGPLKSFLYSDPSWLWDEETTSSQ